MLQGVRAYLDVIYTHPFADGNARAARLWLEYFLRRAGLPSPPLRPLVLRPKPAGDVDSAWGLAALTARLMSGLELQR